MPLLLQVVRQYYLKLGTALTPYKLLNVEFTEISKPKEHIT